MKQTVITQTNGGESRRSLISWAIYAIPLFIGGTLATSIWNYVFGKPKAQNDAWTDAGDVSELQGGTPRQVLFERLVVDGWKVRSEKSSVWVVLDAQRHVTAFSPLCTHLGCAYRWQAERKLFACPCHGSTFNVRGEVVTGPASRPLDRYSTRLEGNRLWLGPVQGAESA